MIPISSIFQPEVTAIDHELTKLQHKVSQLQRRKTALDEAESVTAGAIDALRAAVGRISDLAPSAIATLRQTVMGLFGGDGNQGNGGQPVSPSPAPLPILPSDSNGKQHARRHDVVYSDQLFAPADTTTETPLPADEPELAGQHTELACQLDDAPLVGQYTELTCEMVSKVIPVYEDFLAESAHQVVADSAISEPVTISNMAEKTEVENLFELVSLTPNVAYMKRRSDGEIACAYVGFSNKTTARQWGDWLAQIHSVASKFTVRPSKRLTAYKHELKLWSMSLKSIEKLAECDLSKAPPSNHPPVPKRLHERVPTNAELDDLQVGDHVRSVTVRNWTFRITAVLADGFLECLRTDVTTPITSVLSPASIELITRKDVAEGLDRLTGESEEQVALNSLQMPVPLAPRIDRDDVPAGTRLFPISDDLLTEFEVWMSVEVRVMGRFQSQQKQIGRLLQTSLGIEATRPRGSAGRTFGRTLDAVSYLISGSGMKPVVAAQKPVLIGAVADIDDEF